MSSPVHPRLPSIIDGLAIEAARALSPGRFFYAPDDRREPQEPPRSPAPACCRPPLEPRKPARGSDSRTFKLSVYPSASNARRKAAQPHPESRGNPWAAFVSGFLADLWRAGRITLATVRNKRHSLPVLA